MASMSSVLRTCGLIVYLILQVSAVDYSASEPWLSSIKVDSKSCAANSCKYLLRVYGGEFLGHYSWRLTPEEASRGGRCDVLSPNYELREVETDQWESQIEVVIPNEEGKFFFCLRYSVKKNVPFGGQWRHQGPDIFLDPKNDVFKIRGSKNSKTTVTVGQKEDLQTSDWAALSHDIDINNLPQATRPNRNSNDVEILIKDKYVPLNEVNDYVRSVGSTDSVKYILDTRKNAVDAGKIKVNDLLVENLDDNLFESWNSKFLDRKKRQTNINVDESTRNFKYADSLDGNEENIYINREGKANTEKNGVDFLDRVKNDKVLDVISATFLNEDQKNINRGDFLDHRKEDHGLFRRTLIEKVLNLNTKDIHSNKDGFLGLNTQDIPSNIKDNGIHNLERNNREANSNIDVAAKNAKDINLKTFGKNTKGLNLTVKFENDFLHRNKRSDNSNTDVIKNKTTDDLITKSDIIQAKKDLLNAITPAERHENHKDALIRIRKDRQATTEDFDYTSVRGEPILVRIEGLRVEDSEKEPKIVEYSIPSVLADSVVTLRIFGEGLTTRTVIAFTYDQQKSGEPCKFLVKGEYMVKPESLTSKTALFEVIAPSPLLGSKLYICAKNLKVGSSDPFKDEEKYLHQGTESYKILATHTKLLPLWVTLILILICLMFSALFSGLNLGLMSLDRTELKIIANTGTEQERKYARAIMPVRDHGNYLLCSILLGNVAVNSTFTILLDELTSGLFAVIFSTLAIVLLGEITPQAICSRHGLMVGAKSIMVTKAVMAVTAPLAYPVSKLLDYFLGEEIGSVYNRERLKELVKITTDVNDLDKDEVNIISGALELRKKTVSDVMTKLEDVFMLPISSVLDFETMSEIVKSGYSRIPVYEGGRGDIVTVLFIKDLAFVDPDDNTPLRTLCQYYQNPCNFVFEDVTLDVMFKQFKDGHKGHMAFVHRINSEGEGDPFYETIGLVTLEDVIEEMIQSEIIDETDVFMDNRTKRLRNRPQNKHEDFTAFAERHENKRIHVSPQLTLATFQFLSTSVDAFRPDTVSETVLRRLLKQDVIQHIKLKGKSKKDPSTYVFQQGKPVDYFVLILEGRVEVTVGRENLVFEAGPFTYFGVQALTQNVGRAESPTPSAMGSLQNINMDSMLRHTFVPDYSVRAITELFYLTVKRTLYLAAKRATLMEKGALSKGATNEQFDTEVDKHLCNSTSANIFVSMISKKLLGKSTSSASTRDDSGSTSTGYKLLQSVDEDISYSGEHKTPSRQVSPNPLPVSASPHTRSTFALRSPEHNTERLDEQEKLLKSP